MNSQSINNLFEIALNQINDDNISGAQALTLKTCETLTSFINELPSDIEGDSFLALIAKFGRRLIKSKPAIAPIRQLIKFLLKECDETIDPSTVRLKAITFIERFSSWLREIKYRISQHASVLIGIRKTILTHSFSTAVVETFRKAKQENKDFSVIVTESRPVFEGRLLSQQLSVLNVPVTIIVDAAASSYIEKTDMVLLGANRLTDVDFTNRIGSLAIVHSAKRAQIPCYVLAGSDKYLSEDEEPVKLTTGVAQEVWKDVPSGIKILNSYYERIPLRLCSGIICEEGIVPFSQYAQKQGPFFKTTDKF